MRTALSIAAILLVGCNASDDQLANNAAVEQPAEAPIMNAADGGQANEQPPPESGIDPTAPGNQPAPAPPTPPSSENPPPEPSGQATLRAAPARVALGGTVTLSLANGTRGRIGYNLCASSLQSVGGANVQIGRVCTMELRTLEPGRSVTYPYQLPGRLEAGRYRFTTGIELMASGKRTAVRSNPITVR